MLILVFRFINALCVQTFFQPDEYFQSLEPAWQIAFGSQSGAWITWVWASLLHHSMRSPDIEQEWQHQLRSSLHPALFAVIYYVVDKPMEYLGFFPQFRAMILGVLPNIVQAVIAAYGDYYTWQMAQKMYGIGSNATFATVRSCDRNSDAYTLLNHIQLLMTFFSPWQWFCSTRTFSNCLETTMTITALYFWPWEVTISSVPSRVSPKTSKSKKQEIAGPRSTPAIDSALPSIFQTPRAVTRYEISHQPTILY